MLDTRAHLLLLGSLALAAALPQHSAGAQLRDSLRVAVSAATRPLQARRPSAPDVGDAARHTSLAWTLVPVGLGVGLATSRSGSSAGYAASALIGGGVILGPSAGYAEAGLRRHAARGVALRLTGLGLASAALVRAAGCEMLCANQTAVSATALGGVTLLFGSATYDLVRVSRDVRRAAR